MSREERAPYYDSAGDHPFDELTWSRDACKLADIIVSQPVRILGCAPDSRAATWQAYWPSKETDNPRIFGLAINDLGGINQYTLRATEALKPQAFDDFIFYEDRELQFRVKTRNYDGNTRIYKMEPGTTKRCGQALMRLLASAPGIEAAIADGFADEAARVVDAAENIAFLSSDEFPGENDDDYKEFVDAGSFDPFIAEEMDALYAGRVLYGVSGTLQRVCDKYLCSRETAELMYARAAERWSQQKVEHGEA